jgi:hypothetical protein
MDLSSRDIKLLKAIGHGLTYTEIRELIGIYYVGDLSRLMPCKLWNVTPVFNQNGHFIDSRYALNFKGWMTATTYSPCGD